MSILNKIKYQIHRAGISHLFDQMMYGYAVLKNFRENRLFRRSFPDIALPPDYMLYEAFGLRYRSYYEGGKQTARWLVDRLESYIELDKASILDWGCGPGRVIRHLPELLPEASFYGTDYNPRTISWCQEHIPGVQFSLNKVDPPLGYADESFHALYGISIFTHMSEDNHPAWIRELHRVLKPGGILLITTQGNAFAEKLIASESEQFQAGQIVIRQGTREGHLTYNAFHPEEYIKGLIAGYFDLKSHIPGKRESWGIGQDVWCAARIPN